MYGIDKDGDFAPFDWSFATDATTLSDLAGLCFDCSADLMPLHVLTSRLYQSAGM
jgi:hypothetical protein